MNPLRSFQEWNERRLDGLWEAFSSLGIPAWTIGPIAILLLLLKDGKPMTVWAKEWRKERRPIRPGQPLSEWEQLEKHEQSAAKWGWWSLALLCMLTAVFYSQGL